MAGSTFNVLSLLDAVRSGSDAECLIAGIHINQTAYGNASVSQAAVAAGGVEAALNRLRRSNNADVQGTMACLLSSFVRVPEGAAACDAAGGIGLLLPLLLGDDLPTQLFAGNTLVGLMRHCGIGAAANVVRGGGLRGYVRLLYRTDDSEALTTAVGALFFSTDSRELAEAAVAAGAVPPLLACLDSRHGRRIQRGSACALLNICLLSRAGRSAMLASGVPAVARCVQGSMHYQVLEPAADMLAHLEPNGDPALPLEQRMQSAWGADTLEERLERLARSPLGCEVQQAAAAALRNLQRGTVAGVTGSWVFAARPSSESQPAAAAAGAAPSAAAAGSTTAGAAAALAEASLAAPQPRRRPCDAPGCTNTRGLRRCGGCGTLRYCSKACANAHWREHRTECRRLQAERAQAEAAQQP